MNEEEKRKYEAFQYWIQTNTERGVTTIPDNLCLFVVNLIKSLQKENTEFEKLSKDCSYSVDIVRENTRLRRQVFDLELESEKLKKENEELNYKLHSKKIALEIYNRYIPKSKLKDIIDRIDYDIKKTKEIISKNTNIYASYRKNDYQIVRLRAMNTKSLDIKNRLQELLELSELNSEFNSEGKSEE